MEETRNWTDDRGEILRLAIAESLYPPRTGGQIEEVV